jgi:hypothetical protein
MLSECFRVAVRTSRHRSYELARVAGVTPGTFSSWLNDITRDVRAGGLYTYEPVARSFAKILDAGWPSAWLRDSRRLFAQLPDGRVIIVDTASKKSHQVFAAPRGEFAWVAVSRDDRQVILARASEESDIWMATLKQ